MIVPTVIGVGPPSVGVPTSDPCDTSNDSDGHDCPGSPTPNPVEATSPPIATEVEPPTNIDVPCELSNDEAVNSCPKSPTQSPTKDPTRNPTNNPTSLMTEAPTPYPVEITPPPVVTEVESPTNVDIPCDLSNDQGVNSCPKSPTGLPTLQSPPIFVENEPSISMVTSSPSETPLPPCQISNDVSEIDYPCISIHNETIYAAPTSNPTKDPTPTSGHWDPHPPRRE